MMDLILEQITGQGIIGAILAWFMFRNTKLTDKLFNVIQNNTEAVTGLKSSVDHLTEAQKQRRREYQ